MFLDIKDVSSLILDFHYYLSARFKQHFALWIYDHYSFSFQNVVLYCACFPISSKILFQFFSFFNCYYIFIIDIIFLISNIYWYYFYNWYYLKNHGWNHLHINLMRFHLLTLDCKKIEYFFFLYKLLTVDQKKCTHFKRLLTLYECECAGIFQDT